MRLFILLLLLSVVACGPKCVKGHDETKLIPAHTETQTSFIWIGGNQVPIYHDVQVPERWEKVFVCDQYESPDK